MLFDHSLHFQKKRIFKKKFILLGIIKKLCTFATRFLEDISLVEMSQNQAGWGIQKA